MLTASHNPPDDNGVKVINWTGGMIPISCEAELTDLINSPLSNNKLFIETKLKCNCNLINSNSSFGQVIIGTDTRESSPELLLQALNGVQKANATSIVFRMFFYYIYFQDLFYFRNMLHCRYFIFLNKYIAT